MPKPQSAQTDYLAAMRRDLTWFEHALPEAGRLACRLGVEQRSEELWRRDALEELRARIPAQATVVHELLDSIAERAREDRKTMRALEGELGAAFRAIESKVEAVESSLAKHLHQLEEAKQHKTSRTKALRLQHASRTYDTLWSILDNPALSFATIPWPTVEAPQTPEEITPESIRDFLLSEARRDGRSKLEVAKKERTRWHPDKWVTKLERTQESEKVNVKRGIDLVASTFPIDSSVRRRVER